MDSDCPAGTDRSSGWRMVSARSPLCTVFETPRNSIIGLKGRPPALPPPAAAAARARARDARRRGARAGLVRVNSVRLVQVRHAGHPLEQERYERHVAALRQRPEHVTKVGRVHGAEVRRRLHAGQHDPDAPVQSAVDDPLQVVPHLIDGQPPQGVVAPQRHHQDPHIAVERPVEPAETARRRVSRDAHRGDLDRPAGAVDALLQPRRIGVLGPQAEPGGKGVSQNDHPGPQREVVSPGQRRRRARCRQRFGRGNPLAGGDRVDIGGRAATGGRYPPGHAKRDGHAKTARHAAARIAPHDITPSHQFYSPGFGGRGPPDRSVRSHHP